MKAGDEGAGMKKAMMWTDKRGTVHCATGGRVVDSDRGTYVMWTLCGERDIPANKAVYMLPGDAITCVACLAAMGGAVAQK